METLDLSMIFGAERSLKIHRVFTYLVVVSFLLALLPGCSRLSPSAEPTPTVEPTVLPEPTSTPYATPVPLGSEGNPFILALVTGPGGSPPALAAGIQVASRLTQETGYQVQAKEFTDYPSLFVDLKKNHAHITFLPPLTYIYARQRDLVEVSLLSDHFGVFLYGIQFLANKADNFTSYVDPDSGANTAGPDTALAQFKDKRPCWTEPSSISGFIYPASVLMANNISYQDPAELQTHAAVIRGLYVRGICDFGATYSILGDPRTSEYVSDLPGVLDQIQIIWRSDPVIPNLNVSFNQSVPPDLRKILSDGLIAMVQTEDGRRMLSDANDYDIKDLKEYPDSTYAPLRDAVNNTVSPLILMLGK
jgi:phosphonate transport system substrate-binding protein